MGVEPTWLAWKARTLPLSYTRADHYFYELYLAGPWGQADTERKKEGL